MKIVLAAINAKYIHANLAVCSLRAFSDEYKEQIQIKEYTINQYTEDILADLYKEQADMVAFSCYIWNMGMVEELAELLHQLRPEMRYGLAVRKCLMMPQNACSEITV